jgi:hypothetical protein
LMVDRLADIYFIWREVARCPQVLNSLPHVRTAWDCARGLYLVPCACPHFLQGGA